MQLRGKRLGSLWTGGKWVSIADNLGDTRWVGINRPVRLMDKVSQNAGLSTQGPQ